MGLHYNKRFFRVSRKRRGPSVDLEDELDFDAHVEGKLGGAEGQPRMASRLAENLHEEIRRTVDDRRLLGEPLSGPGE